MKAHALFLQMLTIETDACVPWPLSLCRKGYGRVRFDGKMRSAHVLACVAEHGPKPTPQHQAAHICGNQACLNRRHLRWATQKENEADKRLHGTHVQGSRVGTSKLTARQVVEIRRQAAFTSSYQLAKKYPVDPAHIRRIVRGVDWRSVA